MKLYLYDDYVDFVKSCIKQLPNKGRGEIDKISKALGVNASLVSQVLNRHKHFTEDQALFISQYFNLDENESLYFLILVQMARTSNSGLKKLLKTQVTRMRSEALNMEAPSLHDLRDSEKALFYSNWYFSAVWLLSSVRGFDTAEKIAEELKLPLARVEGVLNFLLKIGLCTKVSGKIKMGPRKTLIIDRSSPLHSRHHLNWRVKAMENISKNSTGDIFYTAPIVISKEDADKIKEMLIEMTDKVETLLEPSEPEALFCLNIDWFKF